MCPLRFFVYGFGAGRAGGLRRPARRLRASPEMHREPAARAGSRWASRFRRSLREEGDSVLQAGSHRRARLEVGHEAVEVCHPDERSRARGEAREAVTAGTAPLIGVTALD